MPIALFLAHHREEPPMNRITGRRRKRPDPDRRIGVTLELRDDADRNWEVIRLSRRRLHNRLIGQRFRERGLDHSLAQAVAEGIGCEPTELGVYSRRLSGNAMEVLVHGDAVEAWLLEGVS